MDERGGVAGYGVLEIFCGVCGYGYGCGGVWHGSGRVYKRDGGVLGVEGGGGFMGRVKTTASSLFFSCNTTEGYIRGHLYLASLRVSSLWIYRILLAPYVPHSSTCHLVRK